MPPLQVDLRDAVPLASIAGWGDVRCWSRGLDEEAHGEVLHLVQHGWSDEVEKLRDQLREARRSHPARGSVAKTLDEFERNLKGDVVSVTDGIGSDDRETRVP